MRPVLLTLVFAAALLGAPSVENVSVPGVFEPNLGQAASEACFVGRGAGWAASFLQDGAVVAQSGAQWTMRFQGGAPSPDIAGNGARSSRSGYFAGPNREEWVTDVPHFDAVAYREIYPGIDAVFRAEASQLEYDLHVRPGADVASIALRFEGPDRLEIEDAGSLLLHFSDTTVRHRRPRAFQGDAEVTAQFVIRPDGAIGFDLGKYDPSSPLVIDPLIYSTFIGGSSSAIGNAIAVDGDGVVYIAGFGGGIDFPTTSGFAPNSSQTFFAKINPSIPGRDGLRYLAFVPIQSSTAMALSKDGVLYYAANAGANIPAAPTSNAVQTSSAGSDDAFVLGLDLGRSDAGTVVYATYFGGSAGETVEHLRINSRGHIVVTGRTASTDMPLTFQGFDSSCPGLGCGYAVVIDPQQAGSAGVVFAGRFPALSTPLMHIDAADRINVAGATGASGYPTPRGAQPDCALGSQGSCNSELYYVQLDPYGEFPLRYASYVGGSSSENLNTLVIDHADRVWLAGETRSIDFPATIPHLGVLCPANVPNCTFLQLDNAFIAGFDTDLTGEASRLSLTLGGSRDERALGLALTKSNHLLVAGVTSSQDFPVTAEAYQKDCFRTNQFCSGVDLFFAELDPFTSPEAAIRYASFLKGERSEFLVPAFGASSAIIEDSGSLVAVASTRSRDFPTTPGAFDRVPIEEGSSDRNVILRFDPRLPGAAGLVYSSNFNNGSDFRAPAWTYANGRLYMLSSTVQPELTTTVDAFDRTCAFGQIDSRGSCPRNLSLAIFDPRPGPDLSVEPVDLDLEYVIPDPAPEPIPLTIRSSDPALRYRLQADSDWLIVEPREATGDATAKVTLDLSQVLPRRILTGLVVMESEDPPLRRAFEVRLSTDALAPGALAGVLHAASFEDRAIAPGQIVSIFGENLGTLGGLSTEVGDRQSGSPGGLTSVSNTTVRFDELTAPVLFARHNQVNVVVPYEIAGRRLVTVSVETFKGRSPGYGVEVAPTAPALFTLTGAGSGQAAALNQDGSVNGVDRPAAPGSVIVLYGSGEGVTEPASLTWNVATVPLPTPVAPISVDIGGRSAQVLYAGPAPGFAGLFQINAQLPDGVQGDAVPVTVRAGQGASPGGVTVAVR